MKHFFSAASTSVCLKDVGRFRLLSHHFEGSRAICIEGLLEILNPKKPSPPNLNPKPKDCSKPGSSSSLAVVLFGFIQGSKQFPYYC